MTTRTPNRIEAAIEAEMSERRRAILIVDGGIVASWRDRAAEWGLMVADSSGAVPCLCRDANGLPWVMDRMDAEPRPARTWREAPDGDYAAIQTYDDHPALRAPLLAVAVGDRRWTARYAHPIGTPIRRWRTA